MDNLKNIVVLKNLPSNLVEEAFVILKPNHKLEYISKKEEKSEKEFNNDSNNYIVKEAEMVITSFLRKNDNLSKREVEKLKRKNKKLKITNWFLFALSVLLIIVKG